MAPLDVKVPDIGDFENVPVIEVLVSEGDEIGEEDPLITLESEKATMDVPSPAAGTVAEIVVSEGDEVSEGDLILRLSEGEGGEKQEAEQEQAGGKDEQAEDEAEEDGEGEEGAAGAERRDEAGERPRRAAAEEHGGRVVVVGSGPGGYTAAFRAADLGLEVVLVERFETLGGVCLNVGCIPSKALLHAARVIAETEEAEAFGLGFAEPEIDLDRMREWKGEVVGKLTGGLDGLARRRKVKVVTGTARFTGPKEIDVDGTTIGFDHCIIAAGSRAATLPGFPDDERIVDSTGALELPEIPDRLLVVGGGIIGLEMANVYEALGSRVSVVELTDQLIPGCDLDLVKPLHKRIEPRYESIMLETKVSGVEAAGDGIEVGFEGKNAPDESQTYDLVLVAVGRRANGDQLEIDSAGVEVAEDGTVPVDEQMRTNVDHIYAIGDIVGEPMLAHKAMHEASVAAEVISGRNVAFDARSIPAVAYTDPEVAWTGLTELEAKQQGVDYELGKFPWQASGRALALERPEGLTKLLTDPESGRILGAGTVGPNAGELIAELGLAIEMGANAEDVALTIHPHPTLSETVGLAAEVAEGIATDIYAPKRKKS